MLWLGLVCANDEELRRCQTAFDDEDDEDSGAAAEDASVSMKDALLAAEVSSCMTRLTWMR